MLVLTVTSRVKTWSKSITRRPHGAVASSLLVNPDTHGLSQKWNFSQLPKHRARGPWCTAAGAEAAVWDKRSMPGGVGRGGDAASGGGDDAEGASAGAQVRTRVRSGVAVGSPKGSVRKTRKRGSPSKPAGASRVRGGAAVGSPTGGWRKVAKEGEGESDGSPNRGADVASVAQGSDFAADVSSMEAGMGSLLD